MLTIRDTGKKFELQGFLLKKMTDRNYNAYQASLSDKEIMYDFQKEMRFHERAPGKKRPLDRSHIRLLKSPAIMASGIYTKFLSFYPREQCVRTKLLLQEN